MTRPYSEDLRERIVRVVESGTSRNAAAKRFDVSISIVVKLMQRWNQRGTIKADKYGGWKRSKLAPDGDRIRALVAETWDITSSHPLYRHDPGFVSMRRGSPPVRPRRGFSPIES